MNETCRPIKVILVVPHTTGVHVIAGGANAQMEQKNAPSVDNPAGKISPLLFAYNSIWLSNGIGYYAKRSSVKILCVVSIFN